MYPGFEGTGSYNKNSRIELNKYNIYIYIFIYIYLSILSVLSIIMVVIKGSFVSIWNLLIGKFPYQVFGMAFPAMLKVKPGADVNSFKKCVLIFYA